MARDYLWKRLDKVEQMPYCLDPDDECFYARDFIVHGGWEASRANDLLYNLKKPVSAPERQLRYKRQAIQLFAQELSAALPDGVTMVAIPPSMREDDPLYDRRIENVLERVRELRPELKTDRPFTKATSGEPMHTGGTRSIRAVYDSLRWRGFHDEPDAVAIVDDMITSGASFKACQCLINEHHDDVRVYGFFWCRAFRPGSSGDRDCP